MTPNSSIGQDVLLEAFTLCLRFRLEKLGTAEIRGQSRALMISDNASG